MKRLKTYKRETAWVIAAYCAGMGIAAANGSQPALEVYRISLLPCVAFLAAALGMDEYSKNIHGERK